MKKLSLLLFAVITCLAGYSSQIIDLRCENLDNPLGIDVVVPRLSWRIESGERNVTQSSWRIVAASSLEKLSITEADVWDSGITTSDRSVLVPFGGKANLTSSQKVYWRVEVVTNKGEKLVSKPAHFSMGLLSSSDWKGQWIGLDKAFEWDSETQWARLSARYLRREFSSKKEVKSATAYISGLGLYELYVNGNRVGDQVLAPIATDYNKSVFYNTFDVTTLVKKGKNCIGATLGNGRFYNMRQDFKPHKIKTFGYPKMLFQLEIQYTDGSREVVVSDNTWRVTSNGPIRSNNDFDGEEYDATKELTGWNAVGYKYKLWQKAELVAAPAGELMAQMTPNMKILRTIKPVDIKQLTPDTLIVDMGQNMVGWLEIKARGNRGDRITMRFAETLDQGGRLKTINLRSAKATDVYTLKGEGIERWEPRFVTHGFRFVEVVGWAGLPSKDDFTGKVVSDQMEVTGTFESSNPLLNQIHKNAYWGVMGNYKGIPLDCPQRDERQPWLGDHATGSLGESMVFDNHTLYAKWMDDIEQSQNQKGQLSDIAPPFYMTYYSDNMTWPGTYLVVGEMLNTQFGDTEPIRKHYPSMRKWLQYMMENYMTTDHIITKDKYGDWCVPPESKELIHSLDPNRKTDGELISTAYFYYLLGLMQKFAVIADQPQDIAQYAQLSQRAREGFNKKFFNPTTGQYGNGTVTSNLLPLAFGIVEPENEEVVVQCLIDRIVRGDNLHVSTGVIGTQWLMRELTSRGFADVAYTIATQKDYPSWGYMVEQGATTIWELWNGDTASPKMNSHNHVMLLGDLIVWMYEDLAGIKSHQQHNGYKWLWMQPNPTEILTATKATHKTPYGVVVSDWRVERGVFVWNITIPANSRANILVPAVSVDQIKEGGTDVMQVEGLKFVRNEQGRVNLEIGSGSYTFECPYGETPNRWQQGVVEHEFICENPPFPESHASTIVQTTQGDIVASWFGGTKERNPDVCIWVSRLEGGKWSEPQNVANGIVNDTLRYATWNPVLYQVPGGELQLYYKVGPNVAGWIGKVITSKDGGVSWGLPKDLPAGFIGPVKNKPVLLKDGTLIAPSSTEGDGWKVHFETTRDFGKTWKKIGPINKGVDLKTIQPSVLVHKDGRLQILCRTQQRTIAQSWSSDNGRTWSPMSGTMLPNNNSGTDAVTLQDGRQMLVYNHVLPADSLPRGKGARTPLNVAVSEDGVVWYAALVLEDSPISQYSYPSVIQSNDGMVHIVYTWRRKAIKYVKIDPSKLVLSRIENMKWPSLSETEQIEVVNNSRYKVSACDWMMLKRQKFGAMELAREIGADGLEIDMGSLGQRVLFENKFDQKHFQQQFIAQCNRVGIEYSSVAMSAFYGQSFARRENYEQLVDQCIATMKSLGVRVAFLPMGNQSDLAKEPDLYPIVVERLKVVARKAEAAGVVIGIETSLPAVEEAKLIDAVGSVAVRSYVNFSAIIKRGGDVVGELKTLGRDRIVQIHASNTDGFWIENDPALNMAEVKKTLDAMGWSGWLVVERSRDVADVHNVKRNYGANVKYLKSVFRD